MKQTKAGSGIAGLDEVLGGGFPRDNLYLLRGDSGVGKTTLGIQFLMEGARRGEKTLYLGTSESEHEIRRIAESHAWSLDGVSIHHHAESGDQQSVLHPAEVDLPAAIEDMLSVVEDVSPERLVIDSLSEIRVLARDDLWYRRQLILLKQYFLARQCTVLLVEIPVANQQTLNSIVSGVVELEQITPGFGPDRRRLRIAKIRGHDFASGYHDYQICTGGLEVFPRLVAADHERRTSEERFGTGLSELDDMLGGGLARGSSTLLIGPSGTGKSIAATQVAVAAAERGERSMIYSFDERLQTLFERSESIGLPLARHVNDGTIQVQQVDPAAMTCGQFSHYVKQAVEGNGTRLLVIDSLNGYAQAMPEIQHLTVYLHELSGYLNQRGASAVFTTTQHGLISERSSQPFDVSYLADAVVLFRHFEYAGQVRKAVSVYKCRYGAHETTIRELQIGDGGLHLGQPLKDFSGVLSGAPRFVGERLHGAASGHETSTPDAPDG